MNLEIGQHGAYPTKEVRRVPVASRNFTIDGGTNRAFNSGGGTSRVSSNAGGAARTFNSEEGTSRVSRNAGGTAMAFNSEEGTSRVSRNAGGTAMAFNSEEGTSRVSRNAGGTARVFNSEEGSSRVLNNERRTTRTLTSEGAANQVFSSEGGRTRDFTSEGGQMGKTLKADANNNQQAYMQRNISQVSSVFASGSDVETDYGGNRRGRSEALRSSSTDGRLDGNNWTGRENTEVKRQHVVKQNSHPKGSLFGRWKMLNDEFQDKYLDYSSNAERNQMQVSRISDFDRFDNVGQVFTEGKGITTRTLPEENEAMATSYHVTSNKSYSVTEPVVSKSESLEKQSHSLAVDKSKVKHHKTDRAMIKASKKEKKLGMDHGDAQFKREKQIRAIEKKKHKQGKTMEKKAAEFVDGLLEDAWAVCIPRRRSVSMENLVSTETQEKHIAKSEKSRLAEAVQSRESSGHEDRAKMMTSKQVMSSREEWLLENSAAADDKRQRQARHLQDASAEGSSYMGKGATGMNARTRIGGYSAGESAAAMNVRTSVERFSSAAESADDLNVGMRIERAEGGQRSRSSNSSSVFDVHRGGIQQDVGRDLTHIIRPIPGSGSYTRMFSHSRHGSGSSTDQRRLRSSHSEGYASDATPLPSTSREKVRLENGQAISHLALESSRSLEHLNSPFHVRPTSADDKTSTTFEIRQRCWSYDNLSTDCYLEGSDHHASPSVARGLKRDRPPTLTKGMITRVFHGCDEKSYSPGTTPSQDKQVHSEFRRIDHTPYPPHDIRQEHGQSTDYTVVLPIKDTIDAPYHDSRAINSLEMTPYHTSYGRGQSASSSLMKFHAASASPMKFHAASSSPIRFHAASGTTPDLDSPGTTFSNLPIFVADVLSPMTEDYHPENQFEVRRQNTVASTMSDDGGSCVANADVHMTRDQILNFYVFNQQTPGKSSQVQEITRSITLGDERAPTNSRETQTAGNKRELIQKYVATEREAPKEVHRRIQPKGPTETIHYITHQREIETLPAKRSVESTSAQTDLEGFNTTDSEWSSSRGIPVQMMASKKSEDRPIETSSSFDEYFEEDTRFPVIYEERGSLPVRVVVAKESTTTAPVLAAEKEKEEEEEFMETTIVEEKEEKICMEIREEVEFSMLRKQGTLLERDGGVTSVEPWWIPDRYEAVVDRRKIKTTKTEQLHNDEDYSMKGERHQLRDQGSVPTGRATYQYQVPGVQHQGKGTTYARATGSSSGRAADTRSGAFIADTNSGAFISARREIGLPQRNGMHRNHYFSRQQSSQAPVSLGVYGKALAPSSTAWKTREGKHSQNGGHGMVNWSQMTESTGSGQQRTGSSYEPNNVFPRCQLEPNPSSTAWKTREGKHSQNGGYSMENWSQMAESTGAGEQRIGSSYEPNNVSFGRKSDEMVLREMLDLGDSVGAKTAAVQDITRSTLSSSAYNGGKVTFASQSEPVAETNLIRDKDGNLVKVTERKHSMTKTVEYPAVAVTEVGLRSSEQMRNFDSSYDEGSFGLNSETSDTNHRGSSSEESYGMKQVEHFETMATPL